MADVIDERWAMVDSRAAVEEITPTKITIKCEGSYFRVLAEYQTRTWEVSRGSLKDALEWLGEFYK